jgi:hypothetical protein
VVGDGHIAAGGIGETEDQADGRGLAGAIGAEEPEDIASTDREIETVDGTELLEILGEPVGGEDDAGLPARIQRGRREVSCCVTTVTKSTVSRVPCREALRNHT